MIVRSPCSKHPKSPKLDSLGMRYNTKRKTKKNHENKTFFIENNIFQKSKIFKKTFWKRHFLKKTLFWKNEWLFEKVTFWKFSIFEKCHRIFLKKKSFFFSRDFSFSRFIISHPQAVQFWASNSSTSTFGHGLCARHFTKIRKNTNFVLTIPIV